VPALIEDATNELTGSFRVLIQRLMEHLKELDRQVRELEALIQAWHRENEASCKLAKVPGIGPITPSGTAGLRRTSKSGCMAAIFTFTPSQMRAWQTGGVHAWGKT
jgi:transposase